MNKRNLLFVLLLSFCILDVWGYGQTGHRTIAQLASQNLTAKAKKKIDEILDGTTLVVLSTYPDEIKSDSKYRSYFVWHYINMPLSDNYDDIEHPIDIKYGIEISIKMLKIDTVSLVQKRFYLAMLVHLIGDLQQPLHVGRKEDKGGNDISVKWFGDKTNLHAVWDTKMIESYNMSYSELAENLTPPTEKEKEIWEQGSITDWIDDSHQFTESIYASAKPNENLGYRYMYDWFSLEKKQLSKGGVRLAFILNQTFN